MGLYCHFDKIVLAGMVRDYLTDPAMNALIDSIPLYIILPILTLLSCAFATGFVFTWHFSANAIHRAKMIRYNKKEFRRMIQHALDGDRGAKQWVGEYARNLNELGA